MDEKTCKVCGEHKPLTQFYKAAGCVDGRRGECRDCFQAKARARREADPHLKEVARARTRQWQLDNPERYAEQRRRKVEDGRQAKSLRKWHLKKRFGLTPEDFEAMLAEQDGRCAICRRPPREGRTLHVDHDSGAVRRLLCFTCNAGMGMFDHDPVLFIEAAEYLLAFAPDDGADGTVVEGDSR